MCEENLPAIDYPRDDNGFIEIDKKQELLKEELRTKNEERRLIAFKSIQGFYDSKKREIKQKKTYLRKNSEEVIDGNKIRYWTKWHQYAQGSIAFEDLPISNNNMEYGVNGINSQDEMGHTPLHIAATWGNIKTVQTLLKKGANPNILDNTGQTPLDFARAAENELIIKVLISVTSPILQEVYIDEKGKVCAEIKEKIYKSAEAFYKEKLRISSETKTRKKELKTVFSESVGKFDRNPNLLLNAILPDKTLKVFEEDYVKPDGNCGFTSLGTDRENLCKKLFSLKYDEKNRKFLAEEIINAFFTYITADGEEGLCPPDIEAWKNLQNIYENEQKEFDKLFCIIQNKFLDKNALTQDDIKMSINWLENNGKFDDAEFLRKKDLAVFSAKMRLEVFCEKIDVFEYYITALSKNLWLGYKSALLYAKYSNINLYIWRKNSKDKNQLDLIDCHIENENIYNEIHMVHTNGFTHFNILSEPPTKKITRQNGKMFTEKSKKSLNCQNPKSDEYNQQILLRSEFSTSTCQDTTLSSIDYLTLIKRFDSQNISEEEFFNELEKIGIIPLPTAMDTVDSLIFALLPHYPENKDIPVYSFFNDISHSQEQGSIIKKELKIDHGYFIQQRDYSLESKVLEYIIKTPYIVHVFDHQSGKLIYQKGNHDTEFSPKEIYLYFSKGIYYSLTHISNKYKHLDDYASVEINDLLVKKLMQEYCNTLAINVSRNKLKSYLEDSINKVISSKKFSELYKNIFQSDKKYYYMYELANIEEKLSEKTFYFLMNSIKEFIINSLKETMFNAINNTFKHSIKINQENELQLEKQYQSELQNLENQINVNNKEEKLKKLFEDYSFLKKIEELHSDNKLYNLDDIENLKNHPEFGEQFKYLIELSSRQEVDYALALLFCLIPLVSIPLFVFASAGYLVNGFIKNNSEDIKSAKELLIRKYTHHWIEIKVSLNPVDINIIEVDCCYATLSAIILNEKFQELFKSSSVAEIRINAKERFFLDCDVNLPGINLVIVANKMSITKPTMLNVSGRNGLPCKKPKAQNGTEVRLSHNLSQQAKSVTGERGENGQDGHPGESSGNVYFKFEEMIQPEYLKIIVEGGKGADGQDGGDGEEGRLGQDGKDAEDNKNRSIFKWKRWAEIVSGENGEQGKKGGDGGRSGFGGVGGYPGQVFINDKLYNADEKNPYNIQIVSGEVRNGNPGKAGEGGKGGQGGRNGCEYAYQYFGYFFGIKIEKEGRGKFIYKPYKNWYGGGSRGYEQTKTEEEVHQTRATEGNQGSESQALTTQEQSQNHSARKEFRSVKVSDQQNQVYTKNDQLKTDLCHKADELRKKLQSSKKRQETLQQESTALDQLTGEIEWLINNALQKLKHEQTTQQNQTVSRLLPCSGLLEEITNTTKSYGINYFSKDSTESVSKSTVVDSFYSNETLKVYKKKLSQSALSHLENFFVQLNCISEDEPDLFNKFNIKGIYEVLIESIFYSDRKDWEIEHLFYELGKDLLLGLAIYKNNLQDHFLIKSYFDSEENFPTIFEKLHYFKERKTFLTKPFMNKVKDNKDFMKIDVLFKSFLGQQYFVILIKEILNSFDEMKITLTEAPQENIIAKIKDMYEEIISRIEFLNASLTIAQFLEKLSHFGKFLNKQFEEDFLLFKNTLKSEMPNFNKEEILSNLTILEENNQLLMLNFYCDLDEYSECEKLYLSYFEQARNLKNKVLDKTNLNEKVIKILNHIVDDGINKSNDVEKNIKTLKLFCVLLPHVQFEIKNLYTIYTKVSLHIKTTDASKHNAVLENLCRIENILWDKYINMVDHKILSIREYGKEKLSDELSITLENILYLLESDQITLSFSDREICYDDLLKNIDQTSNTNLELFLQNFLKYLCLKATQIDVDYTSISKNIIEGFNRDKSSKTILSLLTELKNKQPLLCNEKTAGHAIFFIGSLQKVYFRLKYQKYNIYEMAEIHSTLIECKSAFSHLPAWHLYSAEINKLLQFVYECNDNLFTQQSITGEITALKKLTAQKKLTESEFHQAIQEVMENKEVNNNFYLQINYLKSNIVPVSNINKIKYSISQLLGFCRQDIKSLYILEPFLEKLFIFYTQAILNMDSQISGDLQQVFEQFHLLGKVVADKHFYYQCILEFCDKICIIISNNETSKICYELMESEIIKLTPKILEAYDINYSGLLVENVLNKIKLECKTECSNDKISYQLSFITTLLKLIKFNTIESYTVDRLMNSSVSNETYIEYIEKFCKSETEYSNNILCVLLDEENYWNLHELKIKSDCILKVLGYFFDKEEYQYLKYLLKMVKTKDELDNVINNIIEMPSHEWNSYLQESVSAKIYQELLRKIGITLSTLINDIPFFERNSGDIRSKLIGHCKNLFDENAYHQINVDECFSDIDYASKLVSENPIHERTIDLIDNLLHLFNLIKLTAGNPNAIDKMEWTNLFAIVYLNYSLGQNNVHYNSNALIELVSMASELNTVSDIISITQSHLSENWLSEIAYKLVCEKILLFLNSDIEEKNKIFEFPLEIIQSLQNIKFNVAILEILNKVLTKEIKLINAQSKFSKEKFIGILKNLSSIITNQSLLNELNDKPITQWKSILEKKSVIDMLAFLAIDDDICQKLTSIINELMRKFDITAVSNFVKRITELEKPDYEYIIDIGHQFINKKLDFNKDTVSLLSTTPFDAWQNLFTKENSSSVSKEFSLAELTKLISLDLNAQNSIDDQALFQKISEINNCFDHGEAEWLNPCKKIKLLDVYDIKEIWIKYLNKNPNWLQNHMDEVIAIIMRGIQLIKKDDNYRIRDTQLLALWLYVDAKNHQQGRLGQVATGEGKTLITAMFAVIQALSGHAVNVITSSPVLAERDATENSELFKLFGITVSNNCDQTAQKNLEERQKRYSAPVVYGDVGSFQRDILLTKFLGKPILGNRDNEIIIVDEVDSMLLDKNDNTLYLSHDIPDLRHLMQLYIEIWCSVHSPELNIPSEENIQKVLERTQMRINDKSISIPKCLESFVNYRLKIWIEMAYSAKAMTLNDQYILEKEIIVMDNDTGVEQMDTQWNNGLHQFLQLLNTRKLTKESLKAVYLSNLSYFQMYSGKIYGITGTLGLESDKNLLMQIYNVDFFKLPRFKKHLFKEEEGKVLATETDWFEKISVELMEKIDEDRSVLIICENIIKAEKLKEYLTKKFESMNIESYTKAHQEFTLGTKENPLSSKKIIIATNLAGRGTDLVIDENLEKQGGLHVILSYMPSNIRIEEQAFGRAARQGKPGSGKYIIHDSDNTDLEEIRKKRDLKAIESTEAFRTTSLQSIDMEKKLFDKFTKSYGEIKENLIGLMHKQYGEKYIEIQLNSLKSHWAFWLDSKEENIKSVTSFTEADLISEYKLFHEKMVLLLQNKDIFKFTYLPHDLIHLAKIFINDKKLLEAKACVDKVINEHPDHAEIAYLYRARILGQETKVHDPSCRKEIKKSLKSARELIHERIQYLTASNEILKKVIEICRESGEGQYKNDFEEQVNNEIQLYRVHLHSIETILGFEFNQTLLDQSVSSDLVDISKKLFAQLVKNPNIVKTFRISKKIQVKISNDNCKNLYLGNPESNQEIILPLSLRFCQGNIINKINAKLDCLENTKNEQQRSISLDDFSDVVISQESLWKKLVNAECLESSLKEIKLQYNIEQKSFILSDELLPYQEIFKHLFKSEIKNLPMGNQFITMTRQICSSDFPLPKTDQEAQALLWNSLLDQNVIKPYQIKFSLKEASCKKAIEKRLDEVKAEVTKTLKGILKEKSKNKPKENNEDKSLLEIVAENIGNIFSDEDQKVIDAFIQAIENSIGKLKSMTEFTVGTENLQKFFKTGEFPPEVNQFAALLFDEVLQLEKIIPWWNWNAFAVAMLGLAQLFTGIVLEVCTLGLGTTIGAVLISEGISDMMYAAQAGLTGTFSWKGYGVHKGISLAMSALTVLTMGIGAGFSIGANTASVTAMEVLEFTAKRIGVEVFKAATGKLATIALEKICSNLPQEIQLRLGNKIKEKIDRSEKINTSIERLKVTMGSLFKIMENKQDAQQLIEKCISGILDKSKGNSVYNQMISTIFSVVEEIPKQILLGSSSNWAFALASLVSIVVNGIEHGAKFFQLINIIPNAFDLLEGRIKHLINEEKKNSSNQNLDRDLTIEEQNYIDNSVNKTKEQLTSIMLNRIGQEIATPLATKGMNIAISKLSEKMAPKNTIQERGEKKARREHWKQMKQLRKESREKYKQEGHSTGRERGQRRREDYSDRRRVNENARSDGQFRGRRRMPVDDQVQSRNPGRRNRSEYPPSNREFSDRNRGQGQRHPYRGRNHQQDTRNSLSQREMRRNHRSGMHRGGRTRSGNHAVPVNHHNFANNMTALAFKIANAGIQITTAQKINYFNYQIELIELEILKNKLKAERASNYAKQILNNAQQEANRINQETEEYVKQVHAKHRAENLSRAEVVLSLKIKEKEKNLDVLENELKLSFMNELNKFSENPKDAAEAILFIESKIKSFEEVKFHINCGSERLHKMFLKIIESYKKKFEKILPEEKIKSLDLLINNLNNIIQPEIELEEQLEIMKTAREMTKNNNDTELKDFVNQNDVLSTLNPFISKEFTMSNEPQVSTLNTVNNNTKQSLFPTDPYAIKPYYSNPTATYQHGTIQPWGYQTGGQQSWSMQPQPQQPQNQILQTVNVLAETGKEIFKAGTELKKSEDQVIISKNNLIASQNNLKGDEIKKEVAIIKGKAIVEGAEIESKAKQYEADKNFEGTKLTVDATNKNGEREHEARMKQLEINDKLAEAQIAQMQAQTQMQYQALVMQQSGVPQGGYPQQSQMPNGYSSQPQGGVLFQQPYIQQPTQFQSNAHNMSRMGIFPGSNSSNIPNNPFQQSGENLHHQNGQNPFQRKGI